MGQFGGEVELSGAEASPSNSRTYARQLLKEKITWALSCAIQA